MEAIPSCTETTCSFSTINSSMVFNELNEFWHSAKKQLGKRYHDYFCRKDMNVKAYIKMMLH